MKRPLTLLFFFSLLSLSTVLDAQIDRGRWLVGGGLNFLNRESNSATNALNSVTNLDLELGYLITSRIAAGAKLELELQRSRATVTYSLWGRYYLMKIPQLFPFTGLLWEQETLRQQRLDNQPPITARKESLFWMLGFDYPIHPQLMLEGIYNFGIFEFFDNPTTNDFDEGESYFDLRLRFLLDSDEQTNTFDLRSILSRGRWMIGGFVQLNPIDRNDQNQFLEADVQPFAARFVISKLLVGARVNVNYSRNIQTITTGLTPFVRYYLPVGRNKAFFAEGSFGYDHIAKKERKELYIGDHQLVRRLGLGYAIFISPLVSLDLQLAQIRTKRYINFSSLSSRPNFSTTKTETEFNVAIHFFLPTKG